MPTIGILLPRSTYYETIGFDIFNGLRAGLDNIGREDIRIVTDNVGFGADKNAVYRAAERLVLEENCSVILAYITHRSAQLLRPLFMSSNRLLIVLDAGANLPQEWPVTPNILYHSLHNSLGAWLTGKLAARSGNIEGGLVTGYYDGGYLHTAAITEGYSRNGGSIQFNHATGYKSDDFTMKPLENFCPENKPTCLLSLFSGDFNEWFLRDLKEIYPNQFPPIYKAPFALEETMLEKIPYPKSLIKGIACWSKNLDNEANKLFCKTLDESGFVINLFSLLGWEGAIIAAQALDLMISQKNNGRLAANELKTLAFDTPRGTIYFHDGSNTTLAPMYEVSIVDNGHGNCSLKVENMLANIEADYDEMMKIELNGSISGWFNSYTCN